ncbi:hypothetical protein J6590_074935 [Homalodisca vitripennis]|nr:hypothetical protein J6590_074935 [Homalodisca vitripennis]
MTSLELNFDASLSRFHHSTEDSHEWLVMLVKKTTDCRTMLLSHGTNDVDTETHHLNMEKSEKMPATLLDWDNIRDLFVESPPSRTLSRGQTANKSTEEDNNNPSSSEKWVSPHFSFL